MRKEDLKIDLTPEEQHNNERHNKRNSQLNRIYIISTICNVIVNFDHGIIPACTQHLKDEMNIDDLFLGILGSMVFAGLMSGSLISGYLFTVYSCKKLILISISMIIASSLGFCFSNENGFLMIISRLGCGFFQVFLVVFYPVWVDYFAEERKTMWLTYLQIGVPFGMFLGYGITGMFNVLHYYFPVLDVNYYFSFL